MKKVHIFNFSIIAIVALLAVAAPKIKAQNKKQQKEVAEVAELSDDASKAFAEIMGIPDKVITERMLSDAEAIAGFPSVVKAAFIFGGTGEKGLIMRRFQSGWSAPTVFKLGGGSAGCQIGASKTEAALLFMTEDNLKNLLESKFEIGADVAAAAGPVGRSVEAATNAQLQAEILSYSKSKGLFAGVSIYGAVIRRDNDANKAVYGMEAKELITTVN